MIIHPPSKSVLLRLRPAAMATLTQIFPKHHKLIDYEGHNLALPHTLHVSKVLRNMDIKVPGPIRHYYDWPRPARFTEVYEHQQATADFLTHHNRCFVLNEMGTMKTSSTIWAVDYLMKLGLVKRCLILCTLSCMEDPWLNEIFDVAMHRNALVLHASAEKRRQLLAKESDFYICNHAGLQIIASDVIARQDIDLIVVDEASVYRNATTNQYKVLEKVVKHKKLWMLTGAPCPNAPTDAWALARLVNPSRVPQYYSQWKRATMNQVSQYKWVPKPGSHQMAYDALQPAIRFKKSECVKLPPVTYANRACTLSKDQDKAYKQMKLHFATDGAGATITAVNAADKINKLRQILCGAIKDPDTGQYLAYDHAPRLQVLKECIEQAAAKVLIIVPFKGIAQMLRQELQDWHDKQGDGKSVDLVNGDVSPTKRNEIFRRFRQDADLNELVCHPAVMSHGLNMTQADMIVFYAPIYSNDQFGQVMDRINRPGQTRKMTIVRIIANALEQGIYGMLDGRRITQENMLALYKREMQL